MKRASFLLAAMLSSFALMSCKSVSLGGDQDDAGGNGGDGAGSPSGGASGGGTSAAGSSSVGGSGGNGGTGPIDAQALGGQGGSGTGSTGSCPPRGFDADCAFGVATYVCVARGGGWEWDYTCPDPPRDAGPLQTDDAKPEDTADATGCDPAKAAQAVSAAGIITVGEAQTLNADLPSSLASSANWGVKAIACSEGGYDLSAVAGKSVCLVSFGTTALCQQQPANVWVVMSDGIVWCIYQSAPLNPGIYSVHDSLCSSPDAAAAS